MSGTSPAYDFWGRLPALTVYEIACMLAGFDPRAMTDAVNSAGDHLDLSEEITLITSAVRFGEIQLAPSESIGDLSPKSSVLRKSLAPWLRANHHESVAAGLCDEPEPPPEGQELERSPSTTLLLQEDCPDIPGKIPPTGASRVAVEAAWELERESGRRPDARKVIERMARWVESGDKHPDILIAYIREKRAIIWLTTASKEREFDVNACSKALYRWHQSRS